MIADWQPGDAPQPFLVRELRERLRADQVVMRNMAAGALAGGLLLLSGAALLIANGEPIIGGVLCFVAVLCLGLGGLFAWLYTHPDDRPVRALLSVPPRIHGAAYLSIHRHGQAHDGLMITLTREHTVTLHSPRAFTEAVLHWLDVVGTAPPGEDDASTQLFMPWPSSPPAVCASCGAATERTVPWSVPLVGGQLLRAQIPECDSCAKRPARERLIDVGAGLACAVAAFLLGYALDGLLGLSPDLFEAAMWGGVLGGLLLPWALRQLLWRRKKPILRHRGGEPGVPLEVCVSNPELEAALRRAAAGTGGRAVPCPPEPQGAIR